MSLTLHLGVLVQNYTNEKRSVNTGDVAGWLEKRYGIMGAFYRVYGDKLVGPALEESFMGYLESVMMGAPPSIDKFGSATQAIQAKFRDFISSKEAESVGIIGTPTHAALMGVNSRLKIMHGPRRPSFRDTGLYMASFRSWID